jgi:hypothetical protein
LGRGTWRSAVFRSELDSEWRLTLNSDVVEFRFKV